MVADSDDIPGHIDLFDSSLQSASKMDFPVSDDEDSVMDVVEEDTAMSVHNSDSDSDLDLNIIIFLESPLATREPVGGSSVMIGVQQDQNTGQFTAASFAHLSNKFLN